MRTLCWVVILFLTACSWRSPNAEFYVMNSSGLDTISDKSVRIAVAAVKAPDLLNRQQMVVYDKTGDRVQILEFERWAEIFPDMLQNTVTNDLKEYLPKAYVKRTRFDSNSFDYGVNIEINEMRVYRNEKAVLSVWCNISDKSGKIIKRIQKEYETAVFGDKIPDLVAAQNRAVHLLSEDIAGYIARL